MFATFLRWGDVPTGVALHSPNARTRCRVLKAGRFDVMLIEVDLPT